MYEERTIRALFDADTITVYQAYNPDIARAAVIAQTFVSPFKRDRMTWIKPSFLWMMYRCGWATKENQENVLAIRMTRSGFEWALRHACLSHFDPTVHSSPEDWKLQLEAAPVRVQWDPEKDINLNNLPYRSIQIGLSGISVEKYLAEWIVGVEDITDVCKQIHRLLEDGHPEQAKALLPQEEIYTIHLPLSSSPSTRQRQPWHDHGPDRTQS
jgi:hypothetical protein